MAWAKIWYNLPKAKLFGTLSTVFLKTDITVVSVVIKQWIHHTLISSPKTTAANVKKHCRNVPLVNSIRICEDRHKVLIIALLDGMS
jgi:hypothetical protein